MGTSTTPTPAASTATTPTPAVDVEKVIPDTLFRLTEGLPIKEIRQMIAEAKDCEAALEADIAILEKKQDTSAVDRMLSMEITPPDRYFAISALFGRLREPLAPPLPPNSTIAAARRANKKRKTNNTTDASYPHSMIQLRSTPEYIRIHKDSTQLLAAWKRLSSHRTAAVFRRPVNPKEAPGYTDRIPFPIDLGLIRKMITASIIKSWADFHQRLTLICHNCVKFNGRESDYGIVTREFEAHLEEVLLQLIQNSSAAAVTPVASAVAPPSTAAAAAAATAKAPTPVAAAATAATAGPPKPAPAPAKAAAPAPAAVTTKKK